MKAAIFRTALACCALIGTCLVAEASPVPAGSGGRLRNVSISQLSFASKDSDSDVPASDWGRLTITYLGAQGVLYLNLSVNENWVVQNLPVLSEQGPDRIQAVSVAFGLGTKRGQRINQVKYGITLASTVSKTAPPSRGNIILQQETDNEQCAVGDKEEGGVPPAGPVKGGAVAEGDKKHTIPNPVNQEAPKEGCIPAALSNSLKTLNANHNLKMDPADISIDALGGVVDFKEGTGTPRGWVKKKKDYVKDKNLPIETTIIEKMEDVPKEIDKKCDVEIRGGGLNSGHVAMVVGIVKQNDGTYLLDIAHDTKQGEPGGTTTESIVYEPDTNLFKGGAWLKGHGLREIIVECPKK